jgi:D-alanine--poly(phosphoribitol) ligase subunit 2
MAKEQIREFIIGHFLRGEGDIKNDESLFGAGIVDSLRLMELIAFIEKNFKISVNMSEVTISNFDTVNNISELVRKKVSKTKN